jgi:hypothetical protein
VIGLFGLPTLEPRRTSFVHLREFERSGVTHSSVGSAISDAIEIEFASGSRLLILGAVDAALQWSLRWLMGGRNDSIPSGVRVWIATGSTDKRRGMNSLTLPVQ